MLTAVEVPGICAMLMALFWYGPLRPGPLMKKPKTSLNGLQAYSGYSSEAKTYLKRSVSEVGMKVMVNLDTSKTLRPPAAMVLKSGSFALLALSVELNWVPLQSAPSGPAPQLTEAALPLVIMMPRSIPTAFEPFLK